MYAAVKIGGFALSIAACLLIALYIKDELSYDRNWAYADRIYRLTNELEENGKILTGNSWPAPMAKTLTTDYPEVEKAGRLMDAPLFYGAGSNQLRRADATQNTFEKGFSYADQGMLDILQVPMVYGDRANALNEPNTMVISKSKADKYFPNENPVGKIMFLNNDSKKPYRIGGVMQDFPTTSHLHYDFLLTLKGHQLWDGEQNTWIASNYSTYVLLKPGTNPAQFQNKLQEIITKYYAPALKQYGAKLADQIAQKAKLFIQPVTHIHLYSANIDDDIEKSDIKFVWLFGAIAFFILIIACINFINLSTAKSANRAKEVGLRKVVGSLRSSLIKQFLTESILYSVLSFILGLAIAILVLPYFNTLAAKHMTIPWTAWWLLPLMIGAAIVIGVFAGLYPSFYLSSFKPINVLKGQLSSGSRNSVLRNGLVVFQFTTSICLIIGTIVVYNQTKYILNKKVGFDKDQVLLIQGTNTLGDKRDAFKNELLGSSAIKSISVSDYLPIAGTKRDGNTFFNQGKKKEEAGVFAQKWAIDHAYLSTMGMHMLQGRYFSKDIASDSAATVINQTMAMRLGLKDPIGKRIENGWQKFTVIGVVEDFNFETMKQSVNPLCLVLGSDNPSIISVKISGTDVKAVIDHISSVWKSFSPSQPFRYTFLDESFANMYSDVQRTGSIFAVFALLSIIIACLGLFALSAFIVEQRTKEIGIRKVLGATASGITTMLSMDFIKLVLVAIVIATPAAWWAMSKWLQDFAFRISISWWMIAIAGFAAVVIALFTICFHSIKVAMMNPVESIRTE